MLAWNCRGIARCATIRQLKAIVNRVRPDVIFLSETKVQIAKMEGIGRSLNYRFAEIVPARGIAGGLCLLWNMDYDIEILCSNKSFIVAKIKGAGSFSDWILAGVYAPTTKLKQLRLWNSLTKFVDSYPLPWMLIGDFNNYTSQEEKEGGNPMSLSHVSEFINFVHSNGLIDIGFTGAPFTWVNKQNTTPTIQIRLDRGLVNAEWRMLFPDATIAHQTRICSDHAPLLLNTEAAKRKGKYPFKFEECWIRDDSSEVVVMNAWRRKVWGSIPSRFIKQVKNTTSALRVWNKNSFGNTKTQIEQLTNQIGIAQACPMRMRNAQHELTLNRNLAEALTRDEWIWRQKSRVNWRVNGDRATKFFFVSTIVNRRRNSINQIQDNSNAWISKRDKIGAAFVEHYKHLFQSDKCSLDPFMDELIPNVINEETNVRLCAMPSNEEIKQVVFSFGSTKSPGPDGLSAIFYQHYWKIVSTDVCNLVKNFFATGVINQEMNFNYVALIPKSKVPTRVNQYRPISLCNVCYKVIAKILANRIKSTLNSIISPLQTAFIPGRSISENIVITQEMIHKLRRKNGKSPLMAIKYDMEKAYDRVEWNFLERILILYGFHPEFVRLVMKCVTTTSLSFLINGRPFGKMAPERGLRQGDPLSSYLFILCGEVLSRLLSRREFEGKISGISIGTGCVPISHLLFADDLICFVKADEKFFLAIKDALELYGSWSGQKVNTEKSGVFFSKNTTNDHAIHMRRLMKMGNISSSSLYLGQPFFLGNSKNKDFNFIIERVLEKVSGWKCKSLTYAGREVLINSTLGSLPSFSMMHFELTKGMCNSLNAIFRKFWWNHDQNKMKNLCPIAWEKLCRPKKFGGLGFRLMKKANIALLAKLAWQIETQADKMWVSLCLQKYCRNEKFMNLRSSHHRYSPIWKGILKSRIAIKLGRCFVVGNGLNIDPFTDPWVPGLQGIKPTIITNLILPKLKVSDLINVNSHLWNQDKLKIFFDHQSCAAISQIRVSNHDMPDEIRWIANSTGNFSVKSCYEAMARNNSWESNGVMLDLVKKVWNSKIYHRHKVFLWRIASGCLLTRKALKKRIQIVEVECPLCNSDEEDEIHLFAKCPVARNIWFSCLGIRIDTAVITSVQELICFILSDVNGIRNWGVAFLKEIWKIRNEITHDPVVRVDLAIIKLNILKARQEVEVQTINNMETGQKLRRSDTWLPPPPGYVKINHDATFNGVKTTIGCVVKDDKSQILVSFAESFSCESALVAEALGLLEAVKYARDMKWDWCCFEGDCKILTSAINAPGIPPPWLIASILNDIWRISNDFGSWNFTFAFREQNQCAHLFAAWAERSSFSGFRTDFPIV